MKGKGERGFCWNVSPKDKKKYPPLEELFKKMWRDYDKYINLEEGDLPFWHSEWTLVGTMAVAASQFGPVMLEYCEKNPKTKKTKRPDAWFRFSEKDEELDMLLEAKRDELSIRTDADKLYDYTYDYLKTGSNYLKQFKDSSWTAAVFFLQIYACQRDVTNPNQYQKLLNSLLKNCKQAYENISNKAARPFWAYYFLRHDQLIEEDKYSAPGVVIFGYLRKVG